jgi:hypothetical protein
MVLSVIQQSRSLAEWVRGQDGQRMARYREYLAFWDGAQWEGRPRARERRVTFNYARTFVRKAVSYLFAEPVDQSVHSDQAPGRSQGARADPVELALAEVAEDNDLVRVDFDTAIDAAVLGDGAFKVTWDAAGRRVRVTPVDVQGLYCWWAPDDVRTLLRVVQVYQVASDAVTHNYGVSGGQAGARWVVEDWRPDLFRMEIAGEVVRSGPNPYPWIPFVVFPNESQPHEFWGVSDLVDLMPICMELNRRISALSQILDLSGAPALVLENVEGSQGVELAPGAKIELPQDARAYILDLLAGGGVELHIKAIEQLYRTLHDVGEIPRTAFGEGDGAISGVALEVQLQPLIQKVKRKRAIWDGVYRRRNRMILDLLAMHGWEVGSNRRTVPVWGPITPRDRPALVADEVKLVAAGIHSRRRAAERLGDDNPPAEFAAWLEEQQHIGALAATDAAPEGGQGDEPSLVG